MTSLRGRLLAYFGLAILISTLLTVAIAVVLSRANIERRILDELGRQADTVAAALSRRSTAVHADRLRRLFSARGQLLWVGNDLDPSAPPPIEAAGNDLLSKLEPSGKTEVAGRTVLYAVRESSVGPVVVARRATLGVTDWRPVVGSLLLAALGGAVVAAAIAFVLAKRLSRPIHEMAAATAKIAAGDPEVSVAVEGNDELAQLASSFNDMTEQLARARDSERTFLMSVSHELKTPLTAIRGYAEGLLEKAVGPREAGTTIALETQRLERLVRDLLDLARLDRRAFSIESQPIDLTEISVQAIERHSEQARAFGIDLVVSTDGPAWAQGDPDRVLQVLSNLIENALRSTPEGGTVVVATEPRRLTVTDSGPGLHPDDAPRAFERFYLHRKYSIDRRVGSGLGLAIVKELVEAMGGTVSVANGREQGAVFSVRLPEPQRD